MNKAERLHLMIDYQNERAARRETAIADGGHEYGVKYTIREGNLPKALEAAHNYDELRKRTGVAGKIQRLFRMKRVERQLCLLVDQEVTGNQELAGIDQESGLLELYNIYDDRQMLAQGYAASILCANLEVVPDSPKRSY